MKTEELLHIGDLKYDKYLFYEALEYYFKALNNSQAGSFSQTQRDIREKISRAYYRLNNYSESLRHLDILETLSDGDQLIRVITLKSICLNLQGKFGEALKCIDKLSDLSSPIATRKHLFTKGTINLRIGQFLDPQAVHEAIKYFTQAQTLIAQAQVQHKITRNLGICYNILGKYYKSLQFFEEAVLLAPNEHAKSYTYNDMAVSYGMLNEFSKADSLLQDCYRIASNMQDQYSLGYTLFNFGEISFLQDKYEIAENYTHQAIDNFIDLQSYPELSNCYKQLNKYFNQKNPDKAQVYFRDYNRYRSKLAI